MPTEYRATTSSAHVGDWVEVPDLHGQRSRRGQIIELLGREGHEHYRVRWDDQHESLLYPTDGVIVTAQHGGASR